MKKYCNWGKTTLTTYSQTGKLNRRKSSHTINYWNQSVIQSLEKKTTHKVNEKIVFKIKSS